MWTLSASSPQSVCSSTPWIQVCWLRKILLSPVSCDTPGKAGHQKGDWEDTRYWRFFINWTSLSTAHGCLLYGSRVVILSSLRPQVLQLLYLGHFGMQRMKQLVRTVVYWPQIDADIVDLCHKCTMCRASIKPSRATQLSMDAP